MLWRQRINHHTGKREDEEDACEHLCLVAVGGGAAQQPVIDTRGKMGVSFQGQSDCDCDSTAM